MDTLNDVLANFIHALELPKEQDQTLMEKDSILENFFETRLEDPFVKACNNDIDFQKAKDEVREVEKTLSDLRLDSMQWKVVNNVLNAYNYKCSEYIKVSYKHGFKDAINLQIELNNLI